MNNRLKGIAKRKILLLFSVAAILAMFMTAFPIHIEQAIDYPENVPVIRIGRGDTTLRIGNIVAADVADYTCDGTDDDVQFQAAVDALPAIGGQIWVEAGTYNFAAVTTVTRAIDNVSVIGVGGAVDFNTDDVTAAFMAGGDYWLFSNLQVDAGGIDMGATTDWMWLNVEVDGTYYSLLTDNINIEDHSALHESGGADAIKLDDLAAPDDNTDLDATVAAHGLLPKLGGGVVNYLRADGAWAAPAGGGDVTGPASSVDHAIVRFDGITGKLIQDYTSNAPTISDTGDVNIDGDLDVENIVVLGTVDGIDVSAHDTATTGVHGVGAETILHTGNIGTSLQAWDTELDDIAALSDADSNFIVGSAGGWVAESGATARTSLGLTIGTDVQAWDTELDDIAALSDADSNFIVGSAGGWVAESGAAARTSLGLTIGTDVAAQTHASQHAVGGADTVFPADPDADQYLMWDDDPGNLVWSTPGGAGDVTGPGSSVDNAIVRFDGVTGKIIQDYTSNAPTISDTGDVNVDGDIDIDNAALAGFIDMAEAAEPGSPAANTLRVFTLDDNGFSILAFKDSSGMVRKFVKDNVFIVYNDSGAQIEAARAVYASGSTGTVPTIELAKADSVATMPAIGVTLEAIADTSYGRVMQVGLLEDVNTSAFAAGEVLYVSAATAGLPTDTMPTAPNLAQELGTVLVSDIAVGSIQIVARSSMAFGIADNKIVQIDSATVADNDYAKFTAYGLEGMDYGEVRTDLGLVIGTDVQAWDTELDDIAALSDADSNFIVGSAGGWVVESGDTVRTSLGLAIGTNVQGYDAGLADIAGLAVTDSNFIVGDGVNWVAETGATARDSLGLTIGTHVQAYDATLTSVGLLGTAADMMLYTTGIDTWAETALTAFGRSILDDADEATFKATVGLVIGADVLAEQTIGIADDNLLEVDDAGAADDDFARFTANGLEGLNDADTLAALSGDAGAAFDWQTQDLTDIGVLFLNEQADAEADVAGDGQIWVNTATPNELYFTDDAGTDFRLGSPVTITYVIDGGGTAITTGEKGHLEIPFDCTITGWTLVADQSGSIVIDVWNDIYANFPPDNGDTITSATPPTITTALKSQDSTLIGWTTAVSAGDILAFNVDSCTDIERITLSIRATKT